MTPTICPRCAEALSEFIRNGTGFTVEQRKPANDSPTLGCAIIALIEAKRQSGRRKRYLNGLRIYLNQFARGRESTPICDVDVDTLEAWFLIRNEKPDGKRSNIGRLSALFSYAVRRGWMQANPCSRLEKPFIDRNPPRILTIEQCNRALHWARYEKPKMLAWLCLALMVGLRPEAEADKVNWSNIDLNSNRMMITGEGTKIRQHRVIDLAQTPAGDWLRIAKEMGSPLGLSNKARMRYTKMLRAHLGDWQNDWLRHSAASYLMEFHQNDGKVAKMLGTSVAMLNNRYKSLVTPEDAARFMALRP